LPASQKNNFSILLEPFPTPLIPPKRRWLRQILGVMIFVEENEILGAVSEEGGAGFGFNRKLLAKPQNSVIFKPPFFFQAGKDTLASSGSSADSASYQL